MIYKSNCIKFQTDRISSSISLQSDTVLDIFCELQNVKVVGLHLTLTYMYYWLVITGEFGLQFEDRRKYCKTLQRVLQFFLLVAYY